MQGFALGGVVWKETLLQIGEFRCCLMPFRQPHL